MTVFILDASVTLRWCFDSGTHPYADSVERQLEAGQAVVPIMWRYEVSAVLARALRTGTLTAEKVAAFLDDLTTFNIVLDPHSADGILTEVHRTAITWRLTSYDAAYLELALRRDLPLATLDDDMRRACLAAGGRLL